jgi:hypothetical protein
MFVKLHLYPLGITITGGSEVTRNGGNFKVPKRDLVTNLQVLFQAGRLRVAEGLPEARTLINELLNFRVKITANAHDTYEAWREGTHDDLVLAVALACWYGERNKSSFLDDVFLEESEQIRRPYLMGSHMMDPGLSWVIADYLKKEKGRR